MQKDNKILKVDNLRASYFKKEILHGVSIDVSEREIVGIIGHNGAGKSTLLKTIFGLIQQKGGKAEGKIVFNGDDITYLEPSRKAEIGIGYLLQGGEVFSNLSVEDNLDLTARNSSYMLKGQKEFISTLFPPLGQFRRKRAGLLSGGERQMLAIGMVLMAKPKLLLLDEPTASLAVGVVEAISNAIIKARDEFGSAILIVEQNIDKCLALSDRVYMMRDGQMVEEGSPPIIGRKFKKLLFEQNL